LEDALDRKKDSMNQHPWSSGDHGADVDTQAPHDGRSGIGIGIVTVSKDSVVGAPISCVSLPSPNICIYAQGPFLERTPLVFVRPEQSSSSSSSPHQRLLVFQSGGTIHGIRYAAQYALVFGGRQVAFVRHALREDYAMRMISIATATTDGVDTSGSSSSMTILTLSDWIWDCRCLPSQESTDTILMGLAHNTVEIWRTTLRGDDDDASVVQALAVRTLFGATRCISYCMDLGRLGHVAVGTVTNDILLWNVAAWSMNILSSSAPSMEHPLVVVESHRLNGHEGVVHAVQFDEACQRLASTSDDRSVRLWQFSSTGSAYGQWTLHWTAWGHTARGWRVAFCQAGLVSTGEDGTARLWQVATGAPLTVLRGHACHCDGRQRWNGGRLQSGRSDGRAWNRTRLERDVSCFMGSIFCGS
jgi:WD40 repeat protein